MLCPIDQTELKIAERGGVEIDHCPRCRGVWLDRGELDKIIDRAGVGGAEYARPDFAPAPYPERRYRDDDDDDDDERRRYLPHGEGYDGRRRKRRESWLGDLFDF